MKLISIINTMKHRFKLQKCYKLKLKAIFLIIKNYEKNIHFIIKSNKKTLI